MAWGLAGLRRGTVATCGSRGEGSGLRQRARGEGWARGRVDAEANAGERALRRPLRENRGRGERGGVWDLLRTLSLSPLSAFLLCMHVYSRIQLVSSLPLSPSFALPLSNSISAAGRETTGRVGVKNKQVPTCQRSPRSFSFPGPTLKSFLPPQQTETPRLMIVVIRFVRFISWPVKRKLDHSGTAG
eukprot:scaffold149799_cov27-Tisochrysis_lutea.AAC.3